MTPSELLSREATSSLPAMLSWALIIWIGAVMTIRQFVLVDKRPVDTAAHGLVGLLLVSALLRQASVQSVLGEMGLSLGTIRVLTHTSAIGSAACALVVGILWKQGRTLNWPKTVSLLSVGVLACGTALYVLAWPATSNGLAVEELFSWRTGAYMFIYSLPTPLAALVAGQTALAHVRQHVSWNRTMFGAVVLLCIAGSVLDHGTRMVSGFMLAEGLQNSFTEARTHSNDVFFLPVVAVLVCLTIPSIVSSIRVRLGRDSAACHARILEPMWTNLSEAVTEVGVPATHDIPVDSSFTEYRMLIDIEDAVHALLPHFPREQGDSPQEHARDIRIAAQRCQTNQRPLHARPSAPSWLNERPRLLAVAAAWNEQNEQPDWDKTMTESSTAVTARPSKKMPHPPRRVPILGDILGMDSERPNQRTLEQMGRLGPLYRRSFIGGAKLTFVGSAGLMREVADETRWERFAGRPIQRLKVLGGEGLFTTANDSPEWAVGHETLMPGFTKEAMVRYHAAMQSVADEASSTLAERSEIDDVAAFMGNVALEVIGQCGFGYSFEPFTRTDRHPFAEALTRTLAYTQQSAIPVIGALTGRARAKQAAADREFLRATVREVVEDRQRSGERKPDLLDLMLHSDGAPMDSTLIADQVITFLVAGHETTGNVLAFAAHYIAQDPEISRRIREEVSAVSEGGPIAYGDVSKLRYTRAVVSEALRLWPTAPGFFRAARADTTLGGYAIKKGEWVFTLLLGVHRDPTVWGETADEFDPERFMGRAPDANQYKPFGTGPRACIGRAFALHEAVLVTATLVQALDFESDSSSLDVEENLTLRPRGLRMRFKRHEHAYAAGSA